MSYSSKWKDQVAVPLKTHPELVRMYAWIKPGIQASVCMHMCLCSLCMYINVWKHMHVQKLLSVCVCVFLNMHAFVYKLCIVWVQAYSTLEQATHWSINGILQAISASGQLQQRSTEGAPLCNSMWFAFLLSSSVKESNILKPTPLHHCKGL